jgi:multiple sugar transport system ATP-binding protein
MASVTFEHVTKRFGAVTAVQDFNLRIADKEFLVLVGPSGCGKTTCLRMLAGLEEITEGSIYIDGRRVNDLGPKDRDLAMVFQSYALYPHMSVFDNMAFALKLRKEKKLEIEQRTNKVAAILDIANLLHRKPKQLSGGQRQRVAVGRAIVREPKVFLFDEPLSNLDAKLRVQTRAEISKLHQQLGTTFIYVTHDQVEAMTMATRIAVLKEGRLQQVDTPQNLYQRPHNIFVAGFIGSPGMNFLDAAIDSIEGQLYVEGRGFRLPVLHAQQAALQKYAGRAIVLGVRPEDLHDSKMVSPGINTGLLEAQVELIEMLGSEALVHFTIGDQPLAARLDPRTQARTGERFQIAVNLDSAHFFDKATEVAIR